MKIKDYYLRARDFYYYLITVFYMIRYHGKIIVGYNSRVKSIKIVGVGGVFIGNNSIVDNCKFIFEKGNNTIKIGDGVKLHHVEFIERHGGRNLIVIGSKTTMGGAIQIEASEGCTVNIGEDCMFSHHIKVFTTDGHSILDNDNKRINETKGVVIKNHVWVGNTVMIMKGSIVPDGSIIGANSTVTSSSCSQNNAIYAGNPAQLVKRNIKWVRKLI